MRTRLYLAVENILENQEMGQNVVVEDLVALEDIPEDEEIEQTVVMENRVALRGIFGDEEMDQNVVTDNLVGINILGVLCPAGIYGDLVVEPPGILVEDGYIFEILDLECHHKMRVENDLPVAVFGELQVANILGVEVKTMGHSEAELGETFGDLMVHI